MSYNLMIEGALDYEELALAAGRLQALELFPIPGGTAPERDALGVALPFRNVKEGVAQMEGLVREALTKGWTVTDLYQGGRIVSEADVLSMVEQLRAE